mmetsp:Transcript_31313/g.82972  ORF Transcript_31313/g.82972 Transcript_31313/m.82972 type:complete len:381 (-) Transcript_31313:22-1164(-)
MGRKKKPQEDDDVKEAPKEKQEEEKRCDSDDDDSSSEPYVRERRHHDIDPEIQQLAYLFSLDEYITQELNDIMIEERRKTWDQDLARLHEILKDAHSPGAMLKMKIKDMESGKFVGKAKCGEKVKEFCKKHRLDKGASTKLEEAMSMREAMGKDVMKDLEHLDEHLAASNAPSKLVSMKLEALRKGFNIGHSIYSREVVAGASGPGVDGVLSKKGPKSLGYSDADLDARFKDTQLSTGGQLMDEATIKKMMMAERKKHQQQEEVTKKEKAKEKPRGRSSPTPLRGRAKEKGKRSSPSRDKKKDRGRSRSRRKRSSTSRDRKKKKNSRSRSAKPQRKKSPSKSRRSRSRSPRGKSSRPKDRRESPRREKSGRASPSRDRKK